MSHFLSVGHRGSEASSVNDGPVAGAGATAPLTASAAVAALADDGNTAISPPMPKAVSGEYMQDHESGFYEHLIVSLVYNVSSCSWEDLHT